MTQGLYTEPPRSLFQSLVLGGVLHPMLDSSPSSIPHQPCKQVYKQFCQCSITWWAHFIMIPSMLVLRIMSTSFPSLSLTLRSSSSISLIPYSQTFKILECTSCVPQEKEEEFCPWYALLSGKLFQKGHGLVSLCLMFKDREILCFKFALTFPNAMWKFGNIFWIFENWCYDLINPRTKVFYGNCLKLLT